MATGLKNITKMGTDVRKIAALLQKKAPPGHMLAYISGEEADLLRERGGSGKHMPDTGIPSFEVEEDTGFGETPAQTQPITSGGEETGFGTTAGPGVGGETLSPLPSVQTSTSPVANVDVTSAGPAQDLGVSAPSYTPTPTAPQYTPTSADRAALLGDQGYGATPAQQAGVEVTPQEPKTETKGMSDQTLQKLGIAGLTGLLGAYQSRKAAAGGQAASQQLQQLATPYQQQGQALQAQAQQGTLTPAGQQSLQALQAQVAQGVQSRGGVGVAQASQQVEALRQQLLAQQYQLGLQLSGIGDNIAKGAIQTGMQADQYANQLTSSYFNNIARIAAGTPTSITIPTGGNP